MIVIDTSIWIALYRDRSGRARGVLADAVGTEPVSFSPFVITEVLQGARNDDEWRALSAQIDRLPRLDISPSAWSAAAKIFYDIERGGHTLRGTIDCLIAQNCLDHDCTLLHNDRDFEIIAGIRPLKHRPLNLSLGPT